MPACVGVCVCGLATVLWTVEATRQVFKLLMTVVCIPYIDDRVLLYSNVDGVAIETE